MALTDIEKLELELDVAWDVFCDENPEHHTTVLKLIDPKFYELLKLAYQHGYTDGAGSVMRNLKP